jgi:hypothetical protein
MGELIYVRYNVIDDGNGGLKVIREEPVYNPCGEGLVVRFCFDGIPQLSDDAYYPRIVQGEIADLALDPLFWRIERSVEKTDGKTVHWITMYNVLTVGEMREYDYKAQICHDTYDSVKDKFETNVDIYKPFNFVFKSYKYPQNSGAIVVVADEVDGVKSLRIATYNDAPYYFKPGGTVLWQFTIDEDYLGLDEYGKPIQWMPLIRFKPAGGSGICSPHYGPFDSITTFAGSVDSGIATRYVIGSGCRYGGNVDPVVSEFSYKAIIQGMGQEISFDIDSPDPKISNPGDLPS